MEDYNELKSYRGDTEHDMWVDFDRCDSIGEFSNLLNDSDIDNYIDNLMIGTNSLR